MSMGIVNRTKMVCFECPCPSSMRYLVSFRTPSSLPSHSSRRAIQVGPILGSGRQFGGPSMPSSFYRLYTEYHGRGQRGPHIQLSVRANTGSICNMFFSKPDFRESSLSPSDSSRCEAQVKPILGSGYQFEALELYS